MSSVIEVISSGDSFYELSVGDSSPTYDISSNGDIIYEVTLDQPSPIIEVTISDTSPTYDVIEFDAGMLSLALIDDSTPTSFRAYSSFKVSQLLIGYALTNHNHDLVYQPLGSYLTTESDPIFSASPAFGITTGNMTVINNTSGTNTGDQDLSGYSLTSHNHTGVYEPADATILKDADIGVTVQAYNANTTTAGNTFNGASQLVQLNATGQLPAIDGSLLTGITGGGGSSTLTIQNKTTAYTVVAGDLGTIINCTSGTFTVSLTASATLGAGFNCWIWNTSTTASNIITIDPATTETIEGKITITLQRNEGCQIVCDGTNWKTASQKEILGYAENFSSADNRPSSTGEASIAIGRDSIASSTGSLAISASRFSGASSSGMGSISIGDASNASGSFSIAMGRTVTASSSNSFAIGLNSASTGSQAVTGAGAMALGGSYASGTDSFAAAIANNTSSYGATGANSVAIGKSNKSTATTSTTVGGTLLVSSGSYSAVVGGYANQATAQASSVYGGINGLSFKIGQRTLGYGTTSFSSGAIQFSEIVLGRATTDATPTVLTSDNTTESVLNQVILSNNSAYTFTGTVISKQSGSTNVASWKIEGVIVRGTTVGSTVLVASTVTAISNIPAWTLALSADTTNGGLAVTFTGATATNIRTACTIETSEVIYA